jgi:hypothetical protein
MVAMPIPRPALKRIAGLIAVLAGTLLPGCGDGFDFSFFNREDPPEEPTPDLLEPPDEVIRGTIGEVAYIGNASPLEVKGFGLVVGLNGNGSRDVADSIRRYLIDQLKKDVDGQRLEGITASTSVARLLESPDTAVVELTGTIETGSPEGARFDVLVTAATGTQTTSLEGGLLLMAELKRAGARPGASGVLLGKTMGFVRGPVFTSPFADRAAGTLLSDPRRGIVLGGGVVGVERPTSLILRSPLYDRSRRIGQRLNERFGHRPRVGEPVSPAEVLIHTPAQHAAQPLAFARTAAYVYLDNNPAFFERQLRTLGELVETRGYGRDDLVDVARAWEGIGEVAIPYVNRYYAAADPHLAYYAAQAGLRVGDVHAMSALGRIARDPASPHRLAAIEELGRSGLRPAALEVRPLLSDADAAVRVEAYKALRELRDNTIRTRRFAHRLDKSHLDFMLDLAPGQAEPILYARRAAAPRIALVGGNVPVQMPVFYEGPTHDLTIVANRGDSELTVVGRVLPETPLEKFTIPARTAELIATLGERPDPLPGGRIGGLGMSYSQVLRVLSDLTRDGTIAAEMVFEAPRIRDISGPTFRPEAEELSLEEFEAQLREDGPPRPDDESPPTDAAAPSPPPSGRAPLPTPVPIRSQE